MHVFSFVRRSLNTMWHAPFLAVGCRSAQHARGGHSIIGSPCWILSRELVGSEAFACVHSTAKEESDCAASVLSHGRCPHKLTLLISQLSKRRAIVVASVLSHGRYLPAMNLQLHLFSQLSQRERLLPSGLSQDNDL